MKLTRTTYAAIAVVAGAAVALMIVNSDAQPKANAKVLQVPKKATPIPKGIDGKWNLDPMHSTIGFAIPHMGLNLVHGTFNKFEGTLNVNEKDFRKSSVEFKAYIDSIDTNVAPRDAHLKTADFFDAAKYPEMTFRSIRVDRAPNGGFEATGLFTMKGISRRIVIPFTANGPITDPMKFKRASLHSTFNINRFDYGLKYNQLLDNGNLAIGNIVKVTLDLEATKEGTGMKRP